MDAQLAIQTSRKFGQNDFKGITLLPQAILAQLPLENSASMILCVSLCVALRKPYDVKPPTCL